MAKHEQDDAQQHRLTIEEFGERVREILPGASIQVDNSFQLVIYTNMWLDEDQKHVRTSD